MAKSKVKSDPRAMLSSMAGKPKTASSKPSKPVYNDPELDQHVADFIEQKAIEETAKALKLAAHDQITQRVRPFLLEQSIAARKALSSASVNGRLTFTHQNRYSTIPEDRAPAVRKAFGDKADDFFDECFKLSLTEGAANDESVLQTLFDKLGEDFVQKHFVVSRDIKVTAAFHNALWTDRDVQEKAAPFLSDQTIKPASPSLKVS